MSCPRYAALFLVLLLSACGGMSPPKNLDNACAIVKERPKYLTAMKKSKLYDLVKQGRFPAPVRIGPRAVRWRLSAVQEWISGLEGDTTGKEGEA